MFDEKDIWDRFIEAYCRARERDTSLLDHRIWEANLAHRLAVHLKPLFPDYAVDYEYDKSPESKKLLRELDLRDLPEDWTTIQKKFVLRTWHRHVISQHGVSPDIAVHIRGEGSIDQNVLCIECKRVPVEPNDFAWDWCKLQEYTSGRQGFQYQMGILVVFEGRIAEATAWVFRPEHQPERRL